MSSKDKDQNADEVRALRTLEALHGGPDDIDPDVPVDPASVARMRVAIDRAFDLAWKASRKQAKADSEAQIRRDGFLTLTRAALLTKIHEWQRQLGPSLQLAHRQLDVMDDDDLRTLLSDIEEVAARKSTSS